MVTTNCVRETTSATSSCSPTPWPDFEPQTGQFDEGFKLEFDPLLSLDGKVVDAVLKCEIDQVGKDGPGDDRRSVAAPWPRQRAKIEVPQAIRSAGCTSGFAGRPTRCC